MRVVVHNDKEGNEFYSVGYNRIDGEEMFLRGWKNYPNVKFEDPKMFDYFTGLAITLGIAVEFVEDPVDPHWFVRIEE